MPQRTTSKPTQSQIKPAALRKFHARLDSWYKTHGRHDLPWRKTDNPYHIWLSEVMLQQTQVATVRDRFYFPFLTKFPTIAALAAAEQAEVMKAWEGLGYYSRARNLHEAAKRLINPLPVGEGRAQRGVRASRSNNTGNRTPSPSPLSRVPSLSRGERVIMPSSINQLLTLPGIGKNTAHAIAAFAYHQPVAILEANVKRVAARIFALEAPKEDDLWNKAHFLLLGEGYLSEPSARRQGAQNRKRSSTTCGFEHPDDTQIGQRNGLMNPFDYNQAMMDLGSLICTPKKPSCSACPASTLCAGKSAPETFPTPKAKKQVPTREVTIYVREDSSGRLFLEKRDEALLGGLYGFAQRSHQSPATSHQPQYQPTSHIIIENLSGDWRPEMGNLLGEVTHIYSHFKLIGTVVHERSNAKPNSADWYTRDEIATLPLSTLDHKVLALVENGHSALDKKIKPPQRKRKH